MRLIALDLATKVGVAIGRPGSTPTAYSVDLGKGRSEDARFARALVLTDRLIREHTPDLIAIEAAIGGPRTSHFLVGLVACVRGAACARGVSIEAVNIASARKHFVGAHVTSAAYRHLPERARKLAARKAGKTAVMNRCLSLGWSFDGEDAADALCIWDYTASRQSHAHAVLTAGGLFHE